MKIRCCREEDGREMSGEDNGRVAVMGDEWWGWEISGGDGR